MYLGRTSTPWPRREAAINQKEFMMVKVFPTFSSLSMRACVQGCHHKARMHLQILRSLSVVEVTVLRVLLHNGGSCNACTI
jgi:hypothetical protein